MKHIGVLKTKSKRIILETVSDLLIIDKTFKIYDHSIGCQKSSMSLVLKDSNNYEDYIKISVNKIVNNNLIDKLIGSLLTEFKNKSVNPNTIHNYSKQVRALHGISIELGPTTINKVSIQDINNIYKTIFNAVKKSCELNRKKLTNILTEIEYRLEDRSLNKTPVINRKTEYELYKDRINALNTEEKIALARCCKELHPEIISKIFTSDQISMGLVCADLLKLNPVANSLSKIRSPKKLINIFNKSKKYQIITLNSRSCNLCMVDSDKPIRKITQKEALVFNSTKFILGAIENKLKSLIEERKEVC